MPARKLTWTTTQEKNYIRGLGSHRRSRAGMGPIQLLERYIKNMDKRTWDGMDRENIRKYAQYRLNMLRKSIQ